MTARQKAAARLRAHNEAYRQGFEAGRREGVRVGAARAIDHAEQIARAALTLIDAMNRRPR